MLHITCDSKVRIIEEGFILAKLVAAVWETEFIKFLATRAVVHQDDFILV